MKGFKWDLQWFDDPATYTVTVHKDAHMTTATASAASGATGTEITLTLTPASGYEIDEVEVIAGGVTVNMETKKFTIGEANVILYVKSKANNKYKVTENAYVNINGSATNLIRNLTLVKSANGQVVDVECDGTSVTLSAEVVAALVASGVLVKI